MARARRAFPYSPQIRSINVAALARIGGIDLCAEPLFEFATKIIGLLTALRVGRAGAGENNAAESGAAQAIFVVHRRLMDHVGETRLAVGGTIAEEHQVLPSQNGHRRVLLRDVHEQPII